MLLPIAVSVCFVICDTVKGISEKERINLQVCVLLGIAYSSSLGGIATPIGTGPNGFLIQFLAKEGVDIGFLDWFLIGLPITLVLLPILWVLLTTILFPLHFEANKMAKKPIYEMLKKLGSVSQEEKVVACIFVLTATLWIFRKMINQIPAFTGLEDAVIAMIGGLSFFFFKSKKEKVTLLEWKDLEEKFPWGLIFLFGGGMALAYAVTSTGLASWLANLIPTGLGLFILLALLITLIVFLTELTSNIATTMTFIPIIYAVSIKLEVNPLNLMLPITISASCAFMLPVATPPNSIVFASNLVSIQSMVKAGFFLNLISASLLILFGYFYIPLIFA